MSEYYIILRYKKAVELLSSRVLPSFLQIAVNGGVKLPLHRPGDMQIRIPFLAILFYFYVSFLQIAVNFNAYSRKPITERLHSEGGIHA